MDWDDIIYLTLLFFSIGFGFIYRKIEDVNLRKLTGTLVGLGLILVVSGIHSIHILVFFLTNLLIIKLISKKKCHLVSFAFSFTYLIFFRTSIYFNIPYAPAHTNLIIMVQTLKLVGLAFEINSTYMLTSTNKKDLTEEQIAEQDCKAIYPSTVDIFHYAFNYVGILTGPYYTYRSFYDSFHVHFSKYASNNAVTLQKLSILPLFALCFLAGSYVFPISYAWDDEFYNERSFWYRLGYCLPIWFIFRMRIYIGITLSECVCTMAGMGAYPVTVDPKPGAGPTKNFTHLKELMSNEEKARQEEYNFEAIHNIHPYGTEFCMTFRDTMKNWNMCVQYWLAVNVYKRFPSKKWRTIATMMVSSVWHGVYIGYYFTIFGAPIYLPVEDIYVKLYVKENNKNVKCWEWIIWFFKVLSLSYLAVAFNLLTISRVMRFYNSLYHIGYIVYFLLYILGLQLLKRRKRMEKNLKNLKTE